ncbi:MAG: DUF885 domain-containing protein [Proteobacteria bacterium]|nr:DUF885 domain-containing protein [Pseudomonadota bacterium]
MRLMSLSLLALVSCGPKAPPETAAVTESVPVEAANPAIEGVENTALKALLAEHWDTSMEWYPTWATGLGDHRFNEKLTDNSEAAVASRREQAAIWLTAARAIPADSLSKSDALTLALFITSIENNQAREACRFDEWNFSPRSNPLVDLNYLPEIQPLENIHDAEVLMQRWNAIPGSIEQSIEALKRGAADGWYANAESTERVIAQIEGELAKPTAEWVLYSPALAKVEAFSDEDAASFAEDLMGSVDEGIRPALQAYVDFLKAEILPNARPNDASGLSTLPDGATCYAALVRNFTTLDVSAEDRHTVGLAQLESIHDEFREIGGRVYEIDDLAAIFEKLRTDESLYFETSEQVQAKADEALDRATEAMDGAFGILPQAECIVRPVPDYEAPYTTIAYYRRPNPDGSKPGEYFVNTYAPDTRPRHEAEVLAFHEAIPGHHLQIAISQELPGLPMFRKHMGQTAFVEGWGLYSERLADEMGLYSGDVDRLGMLSFDAWRAARLVVDTGIHHKGWSREQAIAFLEENTPLAKNNIDNEVDRYITMPGQALAYKTGQLEILDMRAKAEAALGESFALADFHDVVLGSGAVTLPVLRANVEAWVLAQETDQ